VREIVNSVVTSYTFPIWRVDQLAPKENLIIRTLLGNKRVVLRENPLKPPTWASSWSGPPPGGSSSSKERKKNKTGLIKPIENWTSQIKGESWKPYFREIPLKIFKYHMMREFSRLMPQMIWFSHPKEQAMFFQNEPTQPRISIVWRLGKVNEAKQKNFNVRKQKKWKLKKTKQQPRSLVWVHKQNEVGQTEHAE